MNRRLLCLGHLLAFLLLVETGAAAITFSESGDAGELPVTAQSTGSGPLDIILGNLASVPGFHDVDLFAIKVVDAATFSATVASGGTTVFDTQLFLFNQFGFGVVANDDVASLLAPLSMIPPGFVPSAGLYFLAISEFPDRPLSASGFIFPDTTADPTLVVTNTGPGGTNPASNWDKSGGDQFGGTYEILLTGAEGAQLQTAVPEPSTFIATSLLLSLAAVRFGFKRRCFDTPASR